MRSPEELKTILFADWTQEEIARAAIDGTYPPDEATRLQNLANVLPALHKKLLEEQAAFAEVSKRNPRDKFVRSWAKELDLLQALVTQGLEIGTKHQIWHRTGAVCSKCDALLREMERTLCQACASGRIPPKR